MKRGNPTKRTVYPNDDPPRKGPQSVDPSNPSAPNLVPEKKKPKRRGY